MSSYLDTLPRWPAGKPLPVGAITLFQDPLTRLEYRIDPAYFGGVGAGVGSSYVVLSLTEARALRLSNPPGIVPTALYGITGDWNGAADSLVYVCGVKPTEYHTLGVVYDAQGKGQLVEVDVVSGAYKKLSADDLLSKNNTWLGINDFSEKGMKLPIGGFIDEAGHLFIRQVDVGQRHFMFGRYYSLAKDSLIQWKADEYVSQDGDGDVGLARVGPGMLEVNTGTTGDKATLWLLDLIVSSVTNLALNSFSKLARAFAPYLGSGNSVTADNLVIGGSGNTVNGQTSIVGSSVATTNSSNLVAAFGLVAATLKNLQPGVAAKNLHLKNGTDRESFITLGIGTAGGLIASTATGAVATPILLRWRGTYNAAAYYDAGDTINYQGGVYTSKVSFQGSAQLGYNPDNWLDWGISAGPGGSGYTDTQARAAQLNRTAPTNTTTVTLTAEAPEDYGTFSSGTPTIDATGCVVGKGARFVVGAGAQAPSFTNAPTGQPYKMLGATYATGKAFGYTLYVCVDRIEVLVFAD